MGDLDYQDDVDVDGDGDGRRDSVAMPSRPSQDDLTQLRNVLDTIRGALAVKPSAGVMETERLKLVSATRALASRATSCGSLAAQCTAMACEIMHHPSHRTNGVVDYRARYYAALYLYRASGVKANREAESASRTADVAKRALVAESGSSSSSFVSHGTDGSDMGLRRETVALMLGVLARLTSDGEAAETLLAAQRCADVGAALARWIALRLIDRDRARELTIADLTRLAAVVSKSASVEAKKFCDFGGVSALCASVQIDADARTQDAFLTPAAVVDCAKAIAGFCSASTGCPEHVDAVSVKEEIRAILSSSTGKMSDPVPAVANSLLRHALASLEKYESSGDASATLKNSSQHGSFGDCMAALAAPTQQSQAFGSQIELRRATSTTSLGYEDIVNSPSKPVTAMASSAGTFSSPPPPLARTRSRGSGGALGTPPRGRLPSGSKRTTRTIIRRFALFVLFVCLMFILRAVFLGARV
mmetsp:Transcript_7179/g.26243  ORF Transcript_7179/g.26243 Transcript_7179/m.26243 type:complete len:476 (-) Transcript_7179:35-1462(-)